MKKPFGPATKISIGFAALTIGGGAAWATKVDFRLSSLEKVAENVLMIKESVIRIEEKVKFLADDKEREDDNGR